MHMRITRHIAAGAACALALTVAAGTAQAQGQPRQYVQALTVHAKPDTALDFEAYAKKVMAAAEKIGLKQRLLVYQVTGGGPAYTYMVVSYFDTWAEADAMPSTLEILTRGLGEAEGVKVLNAGRASIASAEQAMYKLAPELCVKPRAYDPPPPFLQIYRVELKPGKVHDWERVVKRFAGVLEQNPDVPTMIRRAAVEGPGFTYITSIPYTSGADRDKFPDTGELLKKALGEDEYRALDQQRIDAIAHLEGYIMKLRPELSRIPK